MSNTDLWDSVCRTDPAYTKEFKKGGGFRGTAVNPTYLVRCATEKFGPCGIGWGYEVESEELLYGAPVKDDQGNETVTQVHKIRLKLWYVHEGQRGEVTHYGQTDFVGKDKWGLFTDEEAPKKSLTDALTKCLSMLGFAGDVHLGLYDDSKYVEEVREDTAPAAGGARKQARSKLTVDEVQRDFAAVQNREQLEAAAEKYMRLSKRDQTQVVEAAQAAKARVVAAETEIEASAAGDTVTILDEELS